jgi:rhodanese-related sulfurtransferase
MTNSNPLLNCNILIFIILLFLYNSNTYCQNKDIKNIDLALLVEPNQSLLNYEPEKLSIEESSYLKSIDEMIAEIKDKKFILINENHNIPQNRIFWRLLARKLKIHGFNKIFIEGILNLDENFEDYNYVSLRMGYYPKEPTFKKFLNEIHNNFKIHEYEISFSHSVFLNDSINDFVKKVSDTFIEKDKAYNMAAEMSLRDYYQAINILNQTEPNDKVIIFCGFGHVSKKPKQYWLPLGFWLKYLQDKPIATIDQVQLLGYADDITNKKLFNKFSSNFYSILKAHNFYLKQYCDTIRDIVSHVDYVVVSPKTFKQNGRSNWINYFNDSKEIFIKPYDSVNYPLYCYVYKNNDLCYFNEKSLDSTMFPCTYDVLKVEKKEDLIMLFVPKDEDYSIIIRDKNDEILTNKL